MGTNTDPDMLDEYDFSKGVRGKYGHKYREGTNTVKLDDDVAAVFPDSESVNDALRALARIIRRHGKAESEDDPTERSSERP